ncbi:hypothetical protein SLEP1_g19046 [Rubroshorea leprosula]|nr:hypothetical protein SLEP1_g19046 [Rubroshorea leprosula]
MLGEFITRCLILLLGYAYPAIECYRAVEKNRIDIQELRFWCKYWIIVAFLTVLERVGDVFVSWLPLYGEVKLALIIYLWSPKTKGTGQVYDTFLQPLMARHETDIERKLLELRAKVWDFALYYWQNCTELGSTKFFEMFQYLANQSGRTRSGDQKDDQQHSNGRHKPSGSGSQSGKNKWAPSAPPLPTINRAVADLPKSHFGHIIAESENNEETTPPGSPSSRSWFRLRRSSKPHN